MGKKIVHAQEIRQGLFIILLMFYFTYLACNHLENDYKSAAIWNGQKHETKSLLLLTNENSYAYLDDIV